MKIGFIGLIMFVWIILAVLLVTSNQTSIGNSTVDVGTDNMTVSEAVDTLTSFEILKWKDLFGIIPIPLPNFDYFTVLFTIGTWQFSFFTGYWEYVRWIIFMPITAMLVFGLLAMMWTIIQGALGR